MTDVSCCTNFYLVTAFVTINKIVYYQHLLVSFEELLSVRLSDPFALVVGCINKKLTKHFLARLYWVAHDVDKYFPRPRKLPAIIFQAYILTEAQLRSIWQGK